ncbi:MAG: ATP-binding cassette subfamily B protein, partial [Glaciecola sp.]
MPIRFFRSTTDALSTAPRADSLVELPANSIDPDPARGWFRRILPLLRNHPRVVSLSLIGLALDNLGVYGLPLVVRSAMDDALVGRTRPLMPFLWLMLAIVLMRLFGDRLHRRNIIATGVLLEYDMRVLIQDHLGRMPFEFHDEAETGQIISRANEDVAVIQQLLSFAPNMAIMYVGSVTILIWMMRVHLGLALVVLATLPLLVFLSIRMRAVMYPVAWLIQARSADIATIVEENVAGAHVVRAMSAEEDQIRRLDVASRRLRWAAEREIGYRATFEPLMQGLPRMTVAGVLLIGGWLAATGSLTIGTLVLFTTYIAHLQGSLGMLGFIVMIGQRARAASGRIFQLLDTQPTIVDSPQAIDLDFPRGDVRFEDVAFGYGHEEPLLRGLNLHIPPGEKLAIVGATGSGKSTVGKLVPRFYDVSAGRILIDDVDIRALSLASLRAHVGIVMDEAFLFTTTIHANIAYARPDATVSEVHAAADAAGAV